MQGVSSCQYGAIDFSDKRAITENKIQKDDLGKDMALTMEKLQEMVAVDISTLTDLRDIVVDTKKPVPKKLNSFAEQTNNVYVHQMGIIL